MPGTLYLVATPIGNLQDITFRALEVLRSVDLIACEDTRHTQKLLNHYRISNKLISYHQHNENERAEQLADRLLQGESIAVVSDAGTPGINDPGFSIVRRCVEIGAVVVPIPGAAAFISAAVSSGLPTDSILFAGFLPARKGERRRRLEELSGVQATVIFYEAPHRLAKALIDCAEVLGDRQAAVARELTKLHEEIIRGSLPDLADTLDRRTVKGEIVIVIDRRSDHGPKLGTASELTSRINELERDGLSAKAALKKAAKEFSISRSEAYRLRLGDKKK